MASPDLIDEPHALGSAESGEHSVHLVLAVYTAVMASSRNEANAFNAAVQTYRNEKPDLTEEEARRAVAEIICRKP